MTVALATVKDLLLPGAWSLGSKFGKNVDLAIDYQMDSILVRIDGQCQTLFTRDEIDDNIYKAEFAPRLTKLLEGDK